MSYDAFCDSVRVGIVEGKVFSNLCVCVFFLWGMGGWLVGDHKAYLHTSLLSSESELPSESLIGGQLGLWFSWRGMDGSSQSYDFGQLFCYLGRLGCQTCCNKNTLLLRILDVEEQ